MAAAGPVENDGGVTKDDTTTDDGSPRPPTRIDDLPNEMLQYIFDFVPRLKDRTQMSLVSRRWNEQSFDSKYLNEIYVCLVVIRQERWKAIRSLVRPYRNITCRGVRGAFTMSRLGYCKAFSRNPDFEKVPEGELPSLEHLRSLDVAGVQWFDIVRLAPNLRKLTVDSNQPNLPVIIQTLPLEDLFVSGPEDCHGLFTEYSQVTKITSVILFYCSIDQRGLEHLCRCCPQLSKLVLYAEQIKSLQCLATLKHLKVLGLNHYDLNLITNSEIVLPTVEFVELLIPDTMTFDDSMRRMLPNVHYVKLCYSIQITNQLYIGFPKIRTLELGGASNRFMDLLFPELYELRELILVNFSPDIDKDFLCPGLPKLTLRMVSDEATRMVLKFFPGVQWIHLAGFSRMLEDYELPPNCRITRSRTFVDLFSGIH